MKAVCSICNSAVEPTVGGVPIVGLTTEQKATELGKAMLEHMTLSHEKRLRKLAVETNVFNGFIVLNTFDIEDGAINAEKEDMRDALLELIMDRAPDDGDFDDEDDPGEGDDPANEDKNGNLSGEPPVIEMENVGNRTYRKRAR